MYRCSKPVIAVHGGAGRWNVDEDTKRLAMDYLRLAVEEGFKVLESGGSAIDAVVRAIKVLEDSGIFNAGMGSVLNVLGEVEMDAGIMDGSTLRAAGVASVSYPRNPIELAKLVMERTDHVLVVGRGADRLAQIFGLEPRGEPPKRIVERYRELVKDIDRVRYWKKLKEILPLLGIERGGTVGAVAIDIHGNVAAGASTGGVWLKLPGRVGDSPIPGAGFYADNRGGGASATGLGETIIMTSLTRRAVELMATGIDAEKACIEVIEELTKRFGKGTAGILAIDREGRIAVVHNTEAMPYAYMCRDRIEVGFTGIRVDI